MKNLIIGLTLVCLLGTVLVAGCGKKQEPASQRGVMPPGPPGAGASGGPAPVAAPPKTTPADLAVLKVKNSLVTNKERLGIENLQVEASGNVLTLRGTVKNQHLKALASQVAAPVAGGMTIRNELQVSGK